MYTVYRHTTPSGKVYIGITRQSPNDRWRRGWGYSTNLVFFRAINKYGWDNIKHEILLDGLTKEEAKAAEVRLIAEHRSTEREYGYNITKGGDAGVSRPHTEEEKERARANWLGSRNPRAREVICLETLVIYKTAIEARRATGAMKIADCCKRTYKHRTSGGYHWAYYDSGKPIEWYSNLLDRYKSEESSRRPMSEERKRKIAESFQKTVICLETGNTYSSMAEASSATGVQKSSICNCCKGKSRTAGGFHWAYYDSDKDSSYYADLLNQQVRDRAKAYKRSDKYLAMLSERSSKSVRCVETGMVYPSQLAAQKATGIGKSEICACCKGRQHTAGGYHWEYAEEGVIAYA